VDVSDAPAPIGEVWARLVRAVAESPAALASGHEHDDVAIAEGYDYWAQVLTFGLRREFHYGDTRHPMFHRLGLDSKIGFDNPDNVYEVARIDPARGYRVSGSRGTAQFLEFSTSVGFPGVVVPPRTVSKLDTTEIDIAADGTIELVVGGSPRDRNWLAVDPEVTSVLVRQVFGEWRADDVPGDFRIVPLDGSDGERDAVFDPAEVAQRLARTAEFVETQTRYWLDYVEALVKRIEPNTFESPGLQGRELVQLNAARAFFTWGLFQLAPDEALVVEIPAPDPDAYLGFHLVNYWLQSLDFVGRSTSCNARQAYIGSDGTIRYVLAHEDPQVPNWMDVGGHPWGGMLFRAALTTEPAQPTATLVPLSALHDALPSDTPTVDAAARQEELRVRRAHIASRFRW
jgi:hypothetical protein